MYLIERFPDDEWWMINDEVRVVIIASQLKWTDEQMNDLRPSRVRTGVAAMGQHCNYQMDITKLLDKKK